MVNVDVNPAKKMLIFIMKKVQIVRNAMRFDSVLTGKYDIKPVFLNRKTFFRHQQNAVTYLYLQLPNKYPVEVKPMRPMPNFLLCDF